MRVTHDGRDRRGEGAVPRGRSRPSRADLDNSDFLFGAMGMLFRGHGSGAHRRGAARSADRGARLPDRGRQPAAVRGLLPRSSVPSRSPTVLPEYSSRRVLCTELADGAKWSEVLGWSQDERNLAAETIYRFAFGGIYRLGVVQRGPPPRQLPLSRPTAGCVPRLRAVQGVPPEEVAQFERLITSMVLDRDLAEVRRVWTDIGVLNDGGRLPDDAARRVLRPLLRAGDGRRAPWRSLPSTHRTVCVATSTSAVRTAR